MGAQSQGLAAYAIVQGFGPQGSLVRAMVLSLTEPWELIDYHSTHSPLAQGVGVMKIRATVDALCWWKVHEV